MKHLSRPSAHALTADREPRWRPRVDPRQPRTVHDDPLWHEGPDEQRARQARRRREPRETRRDRPDARFERSD